MGSKNETLVALIGLSTPRLQDLEQRLRTADGMDSQVRQAHQIALMGLVDSFMPSSWEGDKKHEAAARRRLALDELEAFDENVRDTFAPLVSGFEALCEDAPAEAADLGREIFRNVRVRLSI